MKWKDYGEDENIWENEDNLQGLELITEFERQLEGKKKAEDVKKN